MQLISRQELIIKEFLLYDKDIFKKVTGDIFYSYIDLVTTTFNCYCLEICLDLSIGFV